ncbi:hypothetical protein ACFMBG_06990 [Leisingera sp. D0M16]|uniref:hypothetical protein n=1 Tax=Leisingera coralii TaxID=3351347 RepID=UPI003B788AE9
MGLENSISEMIERQDSLSDKADAAEARHDDYMGQTAPGLQTLLGLLPNQAGIDSTGDGLPDGWFLPANNGFTSWSLAGSSTYGESTAIVPGSLEEEFYQSVPTSYHGGANFRNFTFNFWRFSWDFSAGGEPEDIQVFSQSNVPFTGMFGCWVKEEVPGILDHLTEHALFTRGSNNWAVWHSPLSVYGHLNSPGHYIHPRMNFRTADIPDVGSLLVCGPQALTTKYPADVIGWGFFPGLVRLNDNGDYHHKLNFVTNAWEAKP